MLSCGTLPEIAAWWRRLHSCTRSVDGPSSASSRDNAFDLKSTNPQTLLLHVTRSKSGRLFIRERIKALRREVLLTKDPEKQFMLALYLEKLGESYFDEALREMDRALLRICRCYRLDMCYFVGRKAQLIFLDSDRNSDRCSNGWAKSERARCAKAERSSWARDRALQRHRGRVARLSNANARITTSVRGRLPPTDVEATSADSRKRQKRAKDSRGGFAEGDATAPLALKEQKAAVLSSVADENCSSATTDSGPSSRFMVVDERDASSLSYEEFIVNYAARGLPLVVKGGVGLCFEGGKPWDRQRLTAEAGEKIVPVRQWIPDSVSWARLEDAGQHQLGQLLNPPTLTASDESETREDVYSCSGHNGATEARATHLDEGEKVGDEKRPVYLHDWSLPQNLGSKSSLLTDSFKVPKYFAGDMLQRVAGQGFPYTDSWPSLFVGPKGSVSDTHVDSFGSHFWMGLLEGKKRWLLYPQEDSPLLYPVWPEGCHDPVFEANLEVLDIKKYPASELARRYECVLSAGDVLFVPAGCPHRVENLTDTLALSCNYVDATNVDGAVAALRDQALTDQGQVGALASALEGCTRSLCRQQPDVPWKSLKEWPRQGEMANWMPDISVRPS